MHYRNLGASGLSVSTLCLGTMTFGENDERSMFHGIGAAEDVAHRILSRAVDAGVNFVDTADVYGNDGLSERILGRWFASSGRRDDVVLATKMRFRMQPGPNGTGASRRRIVRCVEDSLRRLQTDRVDLYQIHLQDADTPPDETLRALDDLVTAGKILYAGCSNFAAWRLMDHLARSRAHGRVAYVSAQMQYHLLERNIEREHVPLCLENGVGVLAWSPLAGGFLTGKYRADERPSDGTRLAAWHKSWADLDRPKSWAVLDVVRQVAADRETTATAVALAWVASRPAVASVIIGARSVEQLDQALVAADLALTRDDLDRLDAVSAIDLGYPYAMIQRVQGRW